MLRTLFSSYMSYGYFKLCYVFSISLFHKISLNFCILKPKTFRFSKTCSLTCGMTSNIVSLVRAKISQLYEATKFFD